MPKKIVKYIDLFSGMGGIRLGFEQAFRAAGYEPQCVLASEIKDAALMALHRNFPGEKILGDVSKIKTRDITAFDFLLAGFPCQAFSVAGKQRGFADTRGTLFFEVERILRDKKPYGFILENVEGLVTHDKENPDDAIGRTLATILQSLNTMGYKVTWKVLDAQNFGLAQCRNRVYIVGTKKEKLSLDGFPITAATFDSVMEHGLHTIDNEFSQKLFSKYSVDDLYGKSIKDKRGGDNNIHSWDLGIKGEVTNDERDLLNTLLKERRKKHWAKVIGIDWMDGMPLTTEQIQTFFNRENLQEMLEHLTALGYLVYEHPKKRVAKETESQTRTIYERVPDETKPKGYNIVAGKLSFEFSRILDPHSTTPTMVAMDMETIGVIDNKGIRNLTLREGLRLFGYPPEYSLEDFEVTNKDKRLGFDLLGNTVCVPVIEAVAERLEKSYTKSKKKGGAKNADK